MKLKYVMACALALAATADFASAQGAAGAASDKPVPIVPSGACIGDTAQLLAEHGTLWGHNSTVIAGQTTLLLYDKMVDYFTCMGLAQRNGDACNAVPHFINMSQGYDAEESPRSRCRNNLVKLLYLSGNADAGFCKANTQLMDISAETFCGNVKDMPGACQTAARLLKFDAIPKECYEAYPRTLADCGGNKRCRRTMQVYKAIKTGNAAGLTPYERAAYEGFSTRKTSSCDILLKDLSKTYCNARNAYVKTLAQTVSSEVQQVRASKAGSGKNMQSAAKSKAEPLPAPAVLCTTCQVYQDQMSGQGKGGKKAGKPAVKK